jgi:hypothetical protein
MGLFLLLLTFFSQANFANTCVPNIANIYKAGSYSYLHMTPEKEQERERLFDALVATSTPVIIQIEQKYATGKVIQQIEGIVVCMNTDPTSGERLFNFLQSRVKIFHNDLPVKNIRSIQFDKDLFNTSPQPPSTEKDFIVTIDVVPVADLKINLSFFKNNHLDSKLEISPLQKEGEDSFVYVMQKNPAIKLYKIFVDKDNFITKMVFENGGYFNDLKKYLGEGLFHRNYRLLE